MDVELPKNPDIPQSPNVVIKPASVWPTQEEADDINPEPMFDHDISWGFVHDKLQNGATLYQPLSVPHHPRGDASHCQGGGRWNLLPDGAGE